MSEPSSLQSVMRLIATIMAYHLTTRKHICKFAEDRTPEHWTSSPLDRFKTLRLIDRTS
jgi:hypothetical protein